MLVQAIKTPAVTPGNSLFRIVDEAVSLLPDGSIVGVTSKVVALCEGAVAPLDSVSKEELIHRHADAYLDRPPTMPVTVTMRGGHLVANAGIDESNASGHYVLWPHDPQRSANNLREHLRRRLGRSRTGIMIVDSHVLPLRAGATGMCIAHSGFEAIRDYRGSTDIFGRPFVFEQANVADGLAAAAVAVMGEGAERTPLAVISEASFVTFQDRNPTERELADLRIAPDEDLFSALLSSVEWKRGEGGRN